MEFMKTYQNLDLPNKEALDGLSWTKASRTMNP